MRQMLLMNWTPEGKKIKKSNQIWNNMNLKNNCWCNKIYLVKFLLENQMKYRKNVSKSEWIIPDWKNVIFSDRWQTEPISKSTVNYLKGIKTV